MKRGNVRKMWIGLLGMLFVMLGVAVWPTAAESGPAAPAVVDLAARGWTAVTVTAARGWTAVTVTAPRQAEEMALPAVQQTAVATAAPGQEVVYTLTLANGGQVTQTVTLSDTLPAQLTLLELDEGLSYDAERHTIYWQGTLPPGMLDYSLSLPADDLPYLDLADYGLPNLCAAFVAAGEDCDDQSVTFNLGAEGYSLTLYGRRAYQVVVSSDGFISLEDGTQSSQRPGQPGGCQPPGCAEIHREKKEKQSVPSCGRRSVFPEPLDGACSVADFHVPAPDTPHWLPDTAVPGLRLAGLWQDVDMTASGRWHAAILSGYVAGHDVFYAQWQDAPHAANPDLTSRFAIALVLDGDGPLAGSVFYLYDHISQPDALIAQGYAIGLQDSAGQRGFTYAFAGPDLPPRGTPPAPGMTLQWTPAAYGQEYSRRFQYRVLVSGMAGTTAVNTAHTTWSDDADAWATHYLSIRHLAYLPLMITGGAE